MGQTVSFDYFYGGHSDTFSYYRIPRLLITGQQFKGLSTDAKLLYGLLLDRMGLSSRNGWYDELGYVYIYYPLDEVQADLNCGHDKATKLLSELDTGKGIGLIECVKQGQGRPVYHPRDPPAISAAHRAGRTAPRLPKSSGQDCGFPKSWLRKTGSADCGKSDGSYNNRISTFLLPFTIPADEKIKEIRCNH